MAFIAEGQPPVGAIRNVSRTAITIYIENSGDFILPIRAVTATHDGKVILDTGLLSKLFLSAVGHVHDSEVPEEKG